MSLKLSFIIPVYNCGKLISRCLDSIFMANVDAGSFEVIIVDDGSTDDSVETIMSYAAKHYNIVKINQQNAGASVARNAGLRIARGRYVWFVDADDHIAPDFFKSVAKRLDEISNVDFLCFNYYEAMPNQVINRQLFIQEEIMTGVDYYRRYANSYVWCKLMRRDTLHFEFLDGTKNLEDLYFCLQNLLTCQRILVIPAYGYFYDHTNTVSTSLNHSEANLIKLSNDTLTIQHHIITDMTGLPKDYQTFYRDTLTKTTAGHLYSLLCYYPLNRMRYVVKQYQLWHLYPIKTRTANLKMETFSGSK